MWISNKKAPLFNLDDSSLEYISNLFLKSENYNIGDYGIIKLKNKRIFICKEMKNKITK